MNTKKIAAAATAAALLILAAGYTCFYGGKAVRTAIPDKTITSGGKYTFTGDINGKIKVDAGSDDVELVLDGVNIINQNGPCIRISSAGTVKLTLPEGTENILYSGSSGNPTGEGSAVNSNCSLVTEGSGSMTVYGYNNNGIHSAENIVIESGIINVYANGDCIQADGDITVQGGNISAGFIDSGAADGTEDADGIYGLSPSRESGPDISFNPGQNFDLGSNFNPNSEFKPGNFNFEGKPDDLPEIPDDIPDNMPDGMPQPPGDKKDFSQGEIPGGQDFKSGQEEDSSSVSRKGLKAGGNLTITGGNININSTDDALHCNGSMEICGGSLVLSSGDDGIHADDSIVISDTAIVINSSYEGIEAHHITVNSGTVTLKASDDGFNANGGNDMFGFGGFGSFFGNAASGNDEDSNSEDLPSLVINGGTVSVDASGDGLDSNGDLIINGGTVIIDGPSSSANGALDSGSENGGTLLVNGGTLLAIGASGMAESPEQESEQAFVYENIRINSGSTIIISDSKEKELLSHTAARGGGNIIFSCPGLSEGDVIRITVDGSTTETTAAKTAAGAFGGFGGGFGMPGGFGGSPGQNSRPGSGKKP